MICPSKSRYLSTVAVSLLLSAVLASAADTTSLRVASFNVRNSDAKDGENAWPRRIELFFDTIKALDPDLIGFQEVLAVQHDALVARMPGHTFAGVARNDGKRAGEWSCIAFRTTRFTEISRGDFWLSETPEVPGSKSWDAALTRICSWVRLRDQRSGREFVYANTHFDHVGKVARYEASKLIARRVAALAAGAPALLTGDLNINEDNPAYAVLVRPESDDAIRWIDAFRTVHATRDPAEATTHSFKGRVTGSRIDFIFHSPHFVARSAAIDRTGRDGHYPSDHYPVWAVIDWQ